MTILSGDIKLLASKIMDDVPNGGGGPTGNAVADGASNAIFGDVTERQRAVGGVSIRQLFGAVQTPTTDAYMDPTVVLSQLPNDPNVSITLAKTSMFARRTEIANAIENYLIKSSEWGGYLLENHVSGQRSIQLLQRPGMPTPAIGRTLVLAQNEGLPAQVMQYVRITKVEVTQRTFTYQSGNGLVDYVADVLDCTLSDVLRSNFAGSPPSRYYTRDPAKTVVRDTTVADAATFYGAAALSTLGSIGDSLLRVSSVYTQLVPSARTESAALDQKPASQRTLTLAQTPRLIEVGVTPHTMRIRVGQENRGFAWVQMLKPRPAPGTIVISYMALGNWYTLMDDGLGGFTGSGVGQVIYTTGSLSITLPSIPDAGTSIIFQWGENTAYTSRAGQAGYRAPEFAWAAPHKGLMPNTVVITWMSGGALKTASDDGSGGLAGHATGEVNYAAGQIFLRPTDMLDAGGEFSTTYGYATTKTKTVAGVTLDAGGFGTIVLDEEPAPKSVSVQWATVRNVSASSGTSEIVSSSGLEYAKQVTVVQPPQNVGCYLSVFRAGEQSTQYAKAGDVLSVSLSIAHPQTAGEYTWDLLATHSNGTAADPQLVQGGASSGAFTVTPSVGQTGGVTGRGVYIITIAADCPDLSVTFRALNQVGSQVAVTVVYVDGVGVTLPPAVPPVLPPPADQTRNPVTPGTPEVVSPNYSSPPTPGRTAGGQDSVGRPIYVVLPPEAYTLTPGGATTFVYDTPANTGLLWTAAEVAAGAKDMMGVLGSVKTYTLWK